MFSIKLSSHVGGDGVLHLQIPLDVTDADLEVLVVVSPKSAGDTTESAWGQFLQRAFGSCQASPLAREVPEDFERRERLA
jgi:hypothetical protein